MSTCHLLFEKPTIMSQHDDSCICRADPIWKQFCLQTGKITETDTLEDHKYHSFRDIYTSMICVPVDFSTINQAMCSFKRRNKTKIFITLMPGMYNQRIDIVSTNVQDESVDDAIISPIEYVIRAAFPDKGAALIFQDLNYCNQRDDPENNVSCIKMVGLDNTLSIPTNTTLLRLMNLQILHSTHGTDIWGGNSAISVNGSNMVLSLDRCTLQSDSGRGVGKMHLPKIIVQFFAFMSSMLVSSISFAPHIHN